MLTFQEEGHVYRYNGVVTPSVTQILAPLTDLSRIPPHVLENARQEGIDQHRLVELEMRNNLDEESLPEWLRPRLVGLRKFVRDVGFVMVASEYMVFHPSYKYAGCLDLVGDLRSETRATIDIKRSLLGGRIIGLQTAAYTEAWAKMNPDEKKPTQRFALVLRDNDYRLEPFTAADDFTMFLSCLNIHRLKQQMGRST